MEYMLQNARKAVPPHPFGNYYNVYISIHQHLFVVVDLKTTTTTVDSAAAAAFVVADYLAVLQNREILLDIWDIGPNCRRTAHMSKDEHKAASPIPPDM